MLTLLLLAQAATSTEPIKPTKDAQLAFWRAKAELLTIAPQWESANKKLEAAIAALCTAPAKVGIDSSGELVCEAPKGGK